MKEVAHLLDRAGLESPSESPPEKAAGGLAPAVVLGSYEKLTLDNWPKDALEKFVTVSESKLHLAKERLAQLG